MDFSYSSPQQSKPTQNNSINVIFHNTKQLRALGSVCPLKLSPALWN